MALGDALVSRRVFTTTKLGIEYSITPLGCSLQEPCMAFASWVAEHSDAVVQAQQTYDGEPSDDQPSSHSVPSATWPLSAFGIY